MTGFRTAFLISVPALAFAVTQMSAAEWRYVYPDAKVLVGVDLKRMAESDIGKHFKEQTKPEAGKSEAGDKKTAAFLKAVDQILVSAPDTKGGNIALVQINGNFTEALVHDMIADQQVEAQDIAGHRGYIQKDKSAALVLLDSHTIVAGDMASVKRAVGTGSAPSASVSARIADLSNRYDFWAMFQVPETTPAPEGNPMANPLQDAKDIQLGLSLQGGLAMQIDVSGRSPESAEKMAESMRQLLKAAPAMAQSMPELAQLAEKVDVGVNGDVARIGLKLSGPELQSTADRLMERFKITAQGIAESIQKSMTSNSGAAGKNGASSKPSETPKQ